MAGGGKFIALEGPDGAGKTTLGASIAKELESRGHKVLLTREPGDGPFGPAIRQVLLASDLDDAWTEVFLFLADRRQHCEFVIRPALDAGKWVVCDRFTDSTIVYQGYGRDLSVDLLRKLNRIATSGLTPDHILLLDLPIQDAQLRLQSKDRIDSESAEFHSRVREGFRMEAARDPNRWTILDATEAPGAILESAMRVIIDAE